MKHVFDEIGITCSMYDNSFTEISNIEQAQELADRFDSKKLCREKDTVTIDGHGFSLSECGFTAVPFVRPGMHCTPADCASCSICNKG